MRKIVLLFLSIFIIGCVSCSKTASNPAQNQDIDKQVAVNLEKIDKNYSEETLRALSVILRTNITINNTHAQENLKDNKYLEIAKSTKNQKLINDKNNLIEISLENNSEYSWQKNIKKSKLLEFALKNNINLTSISDIEASLENEKVVGLKIGNKYFDYKTLSDEFGLESNIIENIETTKSEIIIKGKNKGFYNNFDANKSEQLSNDNYNYKDILKLFFNDLKIN